MQWDAEGYVKDFSFVPTYGRAVMELLDLAPASTVLDLGCGDGALTAALAEAGYDARGLDASEELLAVARAAHPGIAFAHGDATTFTVPQPVDAVFSNAVLHWIPWDKQTAVVQCVHRALREGGQFVFECGGLGNNALIHQALARAFDRQGLSYTMPFCFPSVGAYAMLLEENGFAVTFATLFDRPTPLVGARGMQDWIAMFIKQPFEGIEATTVQDIIEEAAEYLRPDLCHDGQWTADYVRLRMKAHKA